MEAGQERPSILRPIIIVAGMIIILAAIKAAASILNQSQGGNYILQRWQRRGSSYHQRVGSGL